MLLESWYCLVVVLVCSLPVADAVICTPDVYQEYVADYVAAAMCQARCYAKFPEELEFIHGFPVCGNSKCKSCVNILDQVPLTAEECQFEDDDNNANLEFCNCFHKIRAEMKLSGVHQSDLRATISSPTYWWKPLVCQMYNSSLKIPANIPSEHSDDYTAIHFWWNTAMNQSYVQKPVIVYLVVLRTRSEPDYCIISKRVQSGIRITHPFENEEYQLQIIGVASDGVVQHANATSDWTKTVKELPLPLPPKNVRLERMTSDTNLTVTAMITWEPPLDMPCYYKIFWYSSDAFFHDERTVRELLPPYSLQLDRLAYSTNYTVEIVSIREREYKESNKSSTWFVTTSCLEANNRSFIICPPPAPENLTATVEKKDDRFCDIHVTWNPPMYVSTTNIIVEYKVTILKKIIFSTNFGIKPYKETIYIPGNTTSVLFTNVEMDGFYSVSVNCQGFGGYSLTRSLSLNISGTAQNYDVVQNDMNDKHAETIFIVGLSVVICIVFFVGYGLCHYIKQQLSKRKMDKARNQHFQSLEQSDPPQLSGLSVTAVKDGVIIDEFEVDFNCLRLGVVIGQGAFGVVHVAKLIIPSCPWKHNQIVAVKMLRNHSSEDQEQMVQEIETLRNIGSHPHIVSLIAYCSKMPNLFIAVEFCNLGNLQSFLNKLREQSLGFQSSPSFNHGDSGMMLSQDKEIHYADLCIDSSSCSVPSYKNIPFYANTDVQLETEAETGTAAIIITPCDLVSFARQITLGMEFLSNNKFVHRDLAARNVLVCEDKTVKISDFGLSRDIYERNEYRKTKDGKLPIKWMAYESIFHSCYTSQSDVWSFGIVLWEIVTLGGSPYPGMSSGELLRGLHNGYRMPKPENCSDEIYSIMQACWKLNPKSRPTFAQLKIDLEKILEANGEYISFDLNEKAGYYKDKFRRESTENTKEHDMEFMDDDNDSAFIDKNPADNSEGETTLNSEMMSINVSYICENKHLLKA